MLRLPYVILVLLCGLLTPIDLQGSNCRGGRLWPPQLDWRTGAATEGRPYSYFDDISQKDARRVLQNMLGWSLPSDAVRIQSIRASGAEAAEVSAEIQTVFRLRLNEGHWQLREIRTAPDRWEQLEVIARAAGTELPAGECDARSEFARSKSDTELTTKRARCLVASLFGVALPSDDVRIKEISPFGLSIGSESAALVVAFVRADFRLVPRRENLANCRV